MKAAQPVSPDSVATHVLDAPPLVLDPHVHVDSTPSTKLSKQPLQPSAWLLIIAMLTVLTVGGAAGRARGFEHPVREEAWIFEQFGVTTLAPPRVVPPIVQPPAVPAALRPFCFNLRWSHSSSLAEPLRQIRSFLERRTVPIDGFIHLNDAAGSLIWT